jgi:uncharacterized protein (DUF736 family)
MSEAIPRVRSTTYPPLPAEPEPLASAEIPLTFRWSVTWNYIAQELAPPGVGTRTQGVTVVREAPAPDPELAGTAVRDVPRLATQSQAPHSPSGRDAANTSPPGANEIASHSGGGAPQPTAMQQTAEAPISRARASALVNHWEMVIPKMARPAVRRPRAMQGARAGSPAAAIAGSAGAAADNIAAPTFLTTGESRFVRSWRWIALGAILAIAILASIFYRPGAAAREENAGTSVSGGWSRRSLLPQGRVMDVYEPSRDEPDFRVEFNWIPDTNGVGWVFRTQTAGDYYAVKLSLLQSGGYRAIAAEHFRVLGGIESPHSRRVAALGNRQTIIRLRMDVSGPAFTVAIDGSPVDYWTDERLGTGAFGFYEERGQRPNVQTLRFTFYKKGAVRTAVTSFR